MIRRFQLKQMASLLETFRQVTTEPQPYVVVVHPNTYKMLKVALKERERWERTYAHWCKYPQHGRRAKRMIKGG